MGNFYPLSFRCFWLHFLIIVHLGSNYHRWIVSNSFLQFCEPSIYIYLSKLVSLILIYYPLIPTILSIWNFLSTGLLLIDFWLHRVGKKPPNMPRILICRLQLLIPLFPDLLIRTFNTFLGNSKGLMSSQTQWVSSTSQFLSLHV